MDSDDKIPKNINSVDSKNSEASHPQCVVCSTTSPDSSFLYTSQTELGTPLHDFVESITKTKLPDQNKCLTICKSCYNSIKALEEAHLKLSKFGEDSTDSDSDIESTLWSQDISTAKTEPFIPIGSKHKKRKPNKRKISKNKDRQIATFGNVKLEDTKVLPPSETGIPIIKRPKTKLLKLEPFKRNISSEPYDSPITKFKPYFTIEESIDSEDINEEEDAKEIEIEENITQTTEIKETNGPNTRYECIKCGRNFFKFSYGRVSTEEIVSTELPHCLICQRRLTRKNSKRMRKPLNSKKRVGCNICKCSFGNENGVISHIKYHTTQTPYQCHACHLKFVKRPHLLTHLKQCDLCSCNIVCYQVVHTGNI